MSKTVTIRLSDEDYKVISKTAKQERRPISNLITHRVMEAIANINVAVDAEMKEIVSDKKVVKSIERGHKQLAQGKGRLAV